MAKMPSMVALLGLLAVAGFQNRDKIADALGGMKGSAGGAAGGTQPGLGGLMGGLGDLLGGRGGSGLSNGLGDLMESFKRSGQADVADSWINPDVPTKGLTPSQVEQALGPENLDELTQRTGLSRDELLTRLSTAIPENVDRMTPGGAFPDEERTRDYFANWGNTKGA